MKWIAILCLLAAVLGASEAWAAAPVIEEVRIWTIQSSFGPGTGGNSWSVTVVAQDSDGAADIRSVRVGGGSASADHPGAYTWTQEGPDRVRVVWDHGSAAG